VAELEEKRSRFIAHLVPYALFDCSLERIRAEHKKASHHVTATRVLNDYGQIAESAKDDGEPAGTSGMPVLKTLIGANLIDVGIIVTRYFGGTKLGTGGLARAYAGAANAAIDKASIVRWQRLIQRRLSAPFSASASLENRISAVGLKVVAREYLDDGVYITVEGAEDLVQGFEA